MNKRSAFFVSEENRRTLSQLAILTGKSKSDLINMAIETALAPLLAVSQSDYAMLERALFSFLSSVCNNVITDV